MDGSSSRGNQNNESNDETGNKRGLRSRCDPTRYQGIWRQPWGKFAAEIPEPLRNSARLWLGTFEMAEEATRAFNRTAFTFQGHMAILNFPNEQQHYAQNDLRPPQFFLHIPVTAAAVHRAHHHLLSQLPLNRLEM